MRQSERAIFGSGICFFKKKLEPAIGIEPMTCRLRIGNTHNIKPFVLAIFKPIFLRLKSICRAVAVLT